MSYFLFRRHILIVDPVSNCFGELYSGVWNSCHIEMNTNSIVVFDMITTIYIVSLWIRILTVKDSSFLSENGAFIIQLD